MNARQKAKRYKKELERIKMTPVPVIERYHTKVETYATRRWVSMTADDFYKKVILEETINETLAGAKKHVMVEVKENLDRCEMVIRASLRVVM